MAFLIDVKLYSKKLRKLTPDTVKEALEDYSFDTTIRFLDEKAINRIKWYDNNHVETRWHLVRPMVFLAADRIEKYGLNLASENDTDIPTKERRFHKVLERTNPYLYATMYAYYRKGGVQLFDVHIDSDKIQDGDTFVYMGPESKKIAETYNDMYDIEIIRARDLKTKLEKEFGMTFY